MSDGVRPARPSMRVVIVVEVDGGNPTMLETSVKRWAHDQRFRDLAGSGGGEVGAIHVLTVRDSDG